MLKTGKNLIQKNLFQLLFLILLSFFATACSGGSSSNGSDPIDCSEGFGDASRCDARDDL